MQMDIASLGTTQTGPGRSTRQHSDGHLIDNAADKHRQHAIEVLGLGNTHYDNHSACGSTMQCSIEQKINAYLSDNRCDMNALAFWQVREHREHLMLLKLILVQSVGGVCSKSLPYNLPTCHGPPACSRLCGSMRVGVLIKQRDHVSSTQPHIAQTHGSFANPQIFREARPWQLPQLHCGSEYGG